MNGDDEIYAACQIGDMKVVGDWNTRVKQAISSKEFLLILTDVAYIPLCGTNLISLISTK